jgi:hypothetical protein
MKGMKEEFYTEKRWLNWINKVKETKFTLPTSEQDFKGGAVFVYIMDDVVLACLKVIARCERQIIDQQEAMKTIEQIRSIVMAEHESLGEDADMMIESLRTALEGVFISSQRYIAGDYDRQTAIPDLIKAAVEREEAGEPGEALAIVGSVGARLIGGESLPELPELPFCITAELVDGIDAISAAMLGDDSYKEDDGTDAEDES